MRAARSSTLRRVVLVLGLAEAAVLLFFLAVMLLGAASSDPIGQSIGMGMAQLTAIPFAVFVLPAQP